MVMYPVGSAAWASLDTNAQKIPEGALLRFVVREPLPVETAEGHPAALHLANANTERFGEITNHVKANPVLDSEPKISVVFRDMFEIEYSRLIAQNGPQKNKPANVFFLCFIPQGCELYEPDTEKRRALRERTSREHDLFIEFLEANGAKAIYSMQDVGSVEIENNGAWNYFMKNVKSGTIIVSYLFQFGNA